ncbi:hypothetical protein GCM10007872_31130 [Gluconobacter sphaericus NBRC 12467]|uniref:Transposase n=1 Tax=Gluconobacter sphaericus NBRC 12467 TaxID=1307951 RepID=A0AA37SIR7_9PROT|nr:transposase [Gluconobacter sphaericus NBRC 12467]GLQ86200.1 hypothetical protein GCM10007872_31130 [Gluconobacter sphaericus NBRC 12467]
MRFLGLGLSDRVPDATLVAVPKQRNTNAEKADLWAGSIPENWQDKPSKLSHKDRHARWTLKFMKAKRQDDGSMPSSDLAIPFFGYKSHVSIDRKFRFIRKWKKTDAMLPLGPAEQQGASQAGNPVQGQSSRPARMPKQR